MSQFTAAQKLKSRAFCPGFSFCAGSRYRGRSSISTGLTEFFRPHGFIRQSLLRQLRSRRNDLFYPDSLNYFGKNSFFSIQRIYYRNA